MFVEAEIWNVAHTDQGYAVLIKPMGINAAVPVFVGQLEAQSIIIGMGDIPMPRPNTHDLFITGLSKTGSTLSKVEITEIRDGIFYSTITIANISGTVELDSRPSDSIALAVRTDCPIYISEKVIDEAAVSLNYISERTEKMNSDFEEKRLEYEKNLDRAIKEEDYEEAARIRDQIKDLDESYFEEDMGQDGEE
ncbi:MAG: bifunctional nuclease family protein [Spirochaetales bacterium]|uniref:Bifunctional nuclease family protein n=1 Tax=Candidatus Thalassospirochaeta sargassi TaxID=3119039 RepID=A0AAJ1MJ31_9SPIO|nr:bifunctional nuclease family protein [Spirochaetales bacterium]